MGANRQGPKHDFAQIRSKIKKNCPYSQISTTALHIRVQDVNDNYPIFDQDEYLRVVEEQAMDFDVPLIIQARDIDGPAQGGGKIFYDIHSINSESTVFKIDPLTGS